MGVGRGQLYEDAQRVVLAQSPARALIAAGLSEVHSVDIDAEARLIALAQADAGASQAVARSVIDPEGAGRGGHAGEGRVETYRVGREGQPVVGRRREGIVVATGRQG